MSTKCENCGWGLIIRGDQYPLCASCHKKQQLKMSKPPSIIFKKDKVGDISQCSLEITGWMFHAILWTPILIITTLLVQKYFL